MAQPILKTTNYAHALSGWEFQLDGNGRPVSRRRKPVGTIVKASDRAYVVDHRGALRRIPNKSD